MEPGINLGFGENYLLWRDLENHPGVRTLLDWEGGRGGEGAEAWSHLAEIEFRGMILWTVNYVILIKWSKCPKKDHFPCE